MNKQKPALGDTVKDTVTGFEGVVVAFTTWQNGCERLSVQPTKLDKDGKPRELQVFDIQQLVVVKAATHLPIEREEPIKRTGGNRQSVGRGQEGPRR